MRFAHTGLVSQPRLTGAMPILQEGAGSDAEKLEAFKQTLYLIKKRLDIFTSLPLSSLNKLAVEKTARELADK